MTEFVGFTDADFEAFAVPTLEGRMAAAARAAFAPNLLNQMEAIKAALPAHYRWLEDYTQPQGIPHGKMTDADFIRIAERLRNRREADCMAGVCRRGTGGAAAAHARLPAGGESQNDR